MSFSRPVKFPLLRLPFLCIESVIRNWTIFDIIFFTLISKKTRRIVKYLKIPLNGIRIFLSDRKWIELGVWFRKWHFRNETERKSLFKEHKNLKKNPLVLQTNAVPLYTSKTDYDLVSYTDGNGTTAVKMAMEFLKEIFKCSVKRVDLDDDNFPESGDIGVKSTVNLSFNCRFGHDQSQKLNLMLEKLEVTGSCDFWMNNTEKGFYVDPKLFKCKEVMCLMDSAACVTRETLLQFEVPRLTFRGCPFSVENIAAFVTQWFHSHNKKFEYLYIPYQCEKFSLETFRTAELNSVPFNERNGVPPSESFSYIDFSKGLEIVRNDGLQATIHVGEESFMFYIWHKQ